MAGCKSRVEQTGSFQRISILPANVLVDDESFNWAALASTFVIQQDLATSASILPSFATDQSGAYGQGASAVVRSTVEKRRGRIRVSAVLTDLSTQKNRQTIESEGPESEGLIQRLDAVSKRLDPERAAPFSTRSDNALQAFVAAAAASNAEGRAKLLDQAVSIDPAFGLAQSALVELVPGRATADPRITGRFVPLDRARYMTLLARINHAPIATQANAQAAVLALAPNNLEALAELGWLSFLQGKSGQGEQILRKAISLSPQNFALQLQLAQGLVASRRFPQAIQILQALSGTNPSVLPGLAAAKLLAGDAKGAEAVIGRFVNLLPPGTPARTFIEQQWKAIVDNQPPGAEMGGNTPLAPGYRAFLEGRFPEAISFWQGVMQQTAGTDLRARAMLAASLEKAGKKNQVEVLPYLPDFTDLYASTAFNQMRRLLKM
ncbi:MAG: tetratricopeptide repeat protein [Bryobacteraceae bacterium]